MARFFIVVGFVISLGAAFTSYQLFQSYDDVKRQRDNFAAKYEQSQYMADSLKSNTRNYEDELIELKRNLEESQASEKRLQREVAQKEDDLKRLEAKVKALESDLSEAQKKMQAQLNQPLETTPVQAPAVSAPEPKAGWPEGTASSALGPDTTVQASPPVEKEEKPLSGKVLTVNRKFNFIVFNMGLQQGLKMADEAVVSRQGERVGLVQIEKIYEKFSAATILDENEEDPIREGDQVQPKV